MNWQDHISVERNVLLGKPVVRGTRIAVAYVTGLLDQGWTEAQILDNFPGLTKNDIAACLQFEKLRADAWDQQIEADIRSGRLDQAGKRCDDDFETGSCTRI
jgi:uncharacterized protein (DUF433 family)